MIKFYDYYTPLYFFRYLMLRNIPPFLYGFVISMAYKKIMREKLNLDFPQKLSEKIQRIKLHGITPEKIHLSDKILAKEYVNNLIPELKYARIYQAHKSFKELDFNSLPEKFVLKTNHAWQTNIIVEDKNTLTNEDLIKLEKFYKKILKINYAYWSYYELQYKDIKPKIFAEELINIYCNNYEIWCFNGDPEFFTYRLLKKHEQGFKYSEQYCFNIKNEQTDFNIRFKNTEKSKIYLCRNKEKLIEYSKILSKNFDFVRVDFMEINNEIYFCELTFTPYSGFIPFYPAKYDLFYGKRLKIDL